ncbi:MAG TPA: hypothetical protein VEA92_01910 [Candidatus Paceibacterota bacterium]|nr:hypothetical protein [Candidatus Paceibacterota bacterium]
MRFSALEDMVAFLANEGVDVEFDNVEKWGKSPAQLFDEYRKGEVKFMRHPQNHELALEATRVRILIQTPTEVLYEIYRLYPSGKHVVQFDVSVACTTELLLRPGWSLSETARGDEKLSDTIARAFEQELGLSMLPGNLPKSLIPINDRYARVTNRLRYHQDYHDVGLYPQQDPPRRSTVYPLWSIVHSHWFEWNIPARLVKDPVLVRNDEDVLIHREWRPR